MNILLVESSAKCKTLLKHLGKSEWRVLPTGGHLERLPEDRKIHPPKEVKKAYWSNRPNDLPKPPWFWTERGEAAIGAIKTEAAKHNSVTFYLAADPDREGERIAWHLEKLLSDVGRCHRVTFQEITKPAVLTAVDSPRNINQDLVDSALIRTFIDRVVGWRASNIAKRFTSSSTNSMGRVQTPTLGFIVERELEREAHVPVRYFEVQAVTSLTDWQVRFHERSDAAAWVDDKSKFDPHRTADSALANTAQAALVAAGSISVADVTSRRSSQRPRPPFSTDALLQAAGSRWGWSPRKTSTLAGQLYEAGHLTYIRTDSTRLASEAVQAGRSFITKTWGDDQLGAATAPRSAAGVQDAHEAIRPTDLTLVTVPDVEPDVQRLYALVRAHTLASLMVPSQRVTLSLKARCENLDCALDGSVGWYTNPGWRRAFQAAGLEKEAEITPITVEPGETLELSAGDAENPNPELREDETKPPARYRAYALVKAMKDAGIGRPSTYARTVERLEEREYVQKEGGALAPTESGRNIWLEAAPLFSMPDEREVFQTDYTAAMESLLDDVAEGRSKASTVWETILEEFKSAHAAAQEACKTASILPRTRFKLMGYLEAAPELTKEIGDLDALTEQNGKEWLAEFRSRGIPLLPSKKQQHFLDELLEATELTLEQTTEAAELKLAGKAPNREEASALIDYLKGVQAANTAPSAKQLKWIVDLAKTSGKDEAGVCALVGLESYSELTGGKGGTASALIDTLQPRSNRG
jgi:DNA topoisomerase-1